MSPPWAPAWAPASRWTSSPSGSIWRTSTGSTRAGGSIDPAVIGGRRRAAALGDVLHEGPDPARRARAVRAGLRRGGRGPDGPTGLAVGTPSVLRQAPHPRTGALR